MCRARLMDTRFDLIWLKTATDIYPFTLPSGNFEE